MIINIRRTVSRAFTFILLTAANFWLFACQASAATTQRVEETNTFETLMAGICFLIIAGWAHKGRQDHRTGRF